MAENNTNEVDLGLDEEAQVDLGDTSPTTGTSTTQETEAAPAMSLSEQMAGGFAEAPAGLSTEGVSGASANGRWVCRSS